MDSILGKIVRFPYKGKRRTLCNPIMRRTKEGHLIITGEIVNEEPVAKTIKSFRVDKLEGCVTIVA